MSDRIKLVNVLDPILDNGIEEYSILHAGQDNTYDIRNSTSISNSSVVFNVPPSSPMVYIDRHLLARFTFLLTFTGTSVAGSNLIQSGYSALRSHPLAKVIETLKVSINNGSSSADISDIIDPISRYINDEYNNEYTYSLSPSTFDQSQEYSELALSVRNPLGSYVDSSKYSATARGAFPLVNFATVVNTPTQAVLRYEITEPIWLSPFSYSKYLSKGFAGVQNLQFDFKMKNDMGNRIWSHDPSGGNTITSIAVDIEAAALLFRSVSPKDTFPIPSVIMRPYYIFQRYVTQNNFPPLVPNGSFTFQSDSIKLQTIPAAIYIYLERIDADKTFTTTDTYLSIESVAIKLANRSGILSEATQQNLYEICRENGCHLSYPEWVGKPMPFFSGTANNFVTGVGSVLKLIPGKDISLPSAFLSPGVNETTEFSVKVNATNINQTETLNVQLCVITQDPGVWKIERNTSQAIVGLISKQDVLTYESAPSKAYGRYYAQSVYGGDFFKDVAETVKDITKGIREFTDSDIFKIAQKVIPLILPMLGAGEMDEMYGGKQIGRKKLKKRIKELM